MKNGFEVRGAVVAVHLRHQGNRLECLIDTADLQKVQEFPGTWYAMWSEDSRTFYVVGRAGGKTTLLHRYLTDAPAGREVDHLFHYGLDNRRSQIKVCGRSENAMNRQGANANSKSGHRGVYWHRKTQTWRFYVTIKGKRIDRGPFTSAAEASSARADRLTAGLTESAARAERKQVA